MKKIKSIIILVLVTIFLSPTISKADIGPKPSLEIITIGLEEDYYLDLLIKENSRNTNHELSEEEEKASKKLKEYIDKDGYSGALLNGSKIPIFGELKGKKQKSGEVIHRFHYLGVPDNFKIGILRKDGKLIISEEIIRKQFNSKVVFDLSEEDLRGDLVLVKGKVKEEYPIGKILVGFFLRLTSTIIIELLVGLGFGFTSKESKKLIIKVNFLTQIILNSCIYIGNLFYGMLASLFIYIVLEVLILIWETSIYVKKLKEQSKIRRRIYGIVANILTFALGIIFSWNFEWIY